MIKGMSRYWFLVDNHKICTIEFLFVKNLTSTQEHNVINRLANKYDISNKGACLKLCRAQDCGDYKAWQLMQDKLTAIE